MSEATNYIPGMCNINPTEITQRKRIGYAGLAVSILSVVLFIIFDAAWWICLLTFTPVFIGATGFLQAKNKFCTGFAHAGMQHADNGDIVTITDKANQLRDKIKARSITLQASAIAAVITAIVTIVFVL